MMLAALDVGRVADWLCTFALHSTLVLGVVLLIGAALRNRAINFQEGALRLSLWAALVSSSVQYFVLGSPWPFLMLASGATLPSGGDFLVTAPATLSLSSAIAAEELPVKWSWPIAIAGVAASFAFVGLAWLWSVRAGLQRVLNLRQPAVDSRVLATAALVARELGMQQSPHVSRCEFIATPIAFGWIRPEICLPARASELEDASLRAMLAHEIAHLRRGDPAWMWLAAWLQALFPWQVLFVFARRRWARLIEFRCDAIAARHSSPTAVARCLLDVAEWLRPDSRTPLVALGMAARASSLRERIEATLQPQSRSRPHRFLAMACSGVSLSALTLAAPGVSATPEDASPPALGVVEAQKRDAATPDADATPAAASPLRTAADLLQQEYSELVAQVASLRADLDRRPRSPALEQLVSMLTHRLLALERLSARLQVRLDRRATEAPLNRRGNQ